MQWVKCTRWEQLRKILQRGAPVLWKFTLWASEHMWIWYTLRCMSETPSSGSFYSEDTEADAVRVDLYLTRFPYQGAECRRNLTELSLGSVLGCHVHLAMEDAQWWFLLHESLTCISQVKMEFDRFAMWLSVQPWKCQDSKLCVWITGSFCACSLIVHFSKGKCELSTADNKHFACW